MPLYLTSMRHSFGSYSIAVLAARHKIAFIVATPTIAIDRSIADGTRWALLDVTLKAILTSHAQYPDRTLTVP
jgi:hypothetical protein